MEQILAQVVNQDDIQNLIFVWKNMYWSVLKNCTKTEECDEELG